jgi:hypothetical protein
VGTSRVAVVASALTLAIAISVLPVQVASAQPPSTTVTVPSNNATVSGTSRVLDAIASPGTTQVQYEITGGALTDSVIATAIPTYFGWVGLWNTTGVPNGTYSLQSVASSDGVSGTSSSVTIDVNNPPPSTTVVLPQSGANATLNAGAGFVFDAIASPGVTQVLIELVNYAGNDVFATWTAIPTIYGWVVVDPPCSSCATGNPVPVSGAFSIVSVASYSDGVSGTSLQVPVTVIVYTTPPS